VQHIDKGVFVSFVWKDSAAALAGLRFGDQILQIDGESVAGWDNSKTLKFLSKANPAKVTFAVRDRPFARVVTVVKDHQNQIGFLFKKGEVGQQKKKFEKITMLS
jgi:syntenin-1